MSNLVYQKKDYRKKGDSLELYKIETSEDASKLYDSNYYKNFKGFVNSSLTQGPIFLVKYDGADVVRLSSDGKVTVGKQKVARVFKDADEFYNDKTKEWETEKRIVEIPYNLKEVAPFLNHIERNYTHPIFASYLSELKSQRQDVFKPVSSWGKGREGLDASPDVQPAKNIAPSILKELEETENKAKKLKELIRLMNQGGEEVKQKIDELTREIDFDLSTGTFIRTAPLKANTDEEASFIRTAPKQCPDCGCTDQECVEGCRCQEGLCRCAFCL